MSATKPVKSIVSFAESIAKISGGLILYFSAFFWMVGLIRANKIYSFFGMSAYVSEQNALDYTFLGFRSVALMPVWYFFAFFASMVAILLVWPDRSKDLEIEVLSARAVREERAAKCAARLKKLRPFLILVGVTLPILFLIYGPIYVAEYSANLFLTNVHVKYSKVCKEGALGPACPAFKYKTTQDGDPVRGIAIASDKNSFVVFAGKEVKVMKTEGLIISYQPPPGNEDCSTPAQWFGLYREALCPATISPPPSPCPASRSAPATERRR